MGDDLVVQDLEHAQRAPRGYPPAEAHSSWLTAHGSKLIAHNSYFEVTLCLYFTASGVPSRAAVPFISGLSDSTKAASSASALRI
jgi:hypothetical protein